MLLCVTGRPPDVGIRRRRQAFSKLALASRALDIPLLVVTPHSTSLKDAVRGWECEEAKEGIEWKRTWFPRLHQPVVYDAMYLADLKAYGVQYKQWLEACTALKIPVFNPILPAKDIVYKHLETNAFTRTLVPNTEYHVTPSKAIRMLDQNPRVCLKPVYGSGGRNIVFVDHLGNRRYRVHSERFYGQTLSQVTDEAGLRELIRTARRQRDYMAQEYIPLIETKEGRKLDFRFTVQRNETGQWTVVAITARYGAPGSTLTNYHAGGQVQSLTRFDLGDNSIIGDAGITQGDLEKAQRLSVGVAQCLEKRHPMLAVLGIDIGQTEEGRQFVYDCNGRPGRDILTDDEVQAYMRSIAGFARYVQDSYYQT